MTELNLQFYDQLAQRMNRQDESLSRIETSQATMMSCLQDNKSAQLAHMASDTSNFKWITWILGGICTAIGTIIVYLIKH